MWEVVEGQFAGDQITCPRAEGQRLGICLTEGGVVVAERLRAGVGLMQHASTEVDPANPPGTLGEGACEESCPARQVSDAPPRSGTCHLHNQFEQPLIGHDASLPIVGYLPVKLGAHLRLHCGRWLVGHSDTPKMLTNKHSCGLW